MRGLLFLLHFFGVLDVDNHHDHLAKFQITLIATYMFLGNDKRTKTENIVF